MHRPSQDNRALWSGPDPFGDGVHALHGDAFALRLGAHRFRQRRISRGQRIPEGKGRRRGRSQLEELFADTPGQIGIDRPQPDVRARCAVQGFGACTKGGPIKTPGLAGRK